MTSFARLHLYANVRYPAVQILHYSVMVRESKKNRKALSEMSQYSAHPGTAAISINQLLQRASEVPQPVPPTSAACLMLTPLG
jgi:hypothetical protein